MQTSCSNFQKIFLEKDRIEIEGTENLLAKFQD